MADGNSLPGYSSSDLCCAAIAVRGTPGDYIDNAVRESALRTAKHIAATSFVLADLINAGKLKIVAAYYDLASGVVSTSHVLLPVSKLLSEAAEESAPGSLCPTESSALCRACRSPA